MYESDTRKQESIAPGRVQCPICEEFAEAVSICTFAFSDQQSIQFQPCSHQLVDEEHDELADIESFWTEEGDVFEIHDINADGSRWIASDTTNVDLGVDLR